MSKGCLFLLDRLGIGGSERKTIVAANRLAERGRSVHIAFLNASLDITATLHPAIRHVVLHRQGKVDLSVVRRLRAYVKRHDIGVVWGVNLYPSLYAFLTARSLRGGVRVIGSSNVTEFRNGYERLKMRIYAPLIRRMDGFVFGCEEQMAMWTERYRLQRAAASVIHNGVLTERFASEHCGVDRAQAQARFGLSPSVPVIGCVAQFRIEKAQGDLVEAARRLHDQGCAVQVLFVGDGVERPSVEALVARHGLLEHVRFAGMMDDVRPALMAMDAFVLTSRAVETFSNAALEAMSMGRPAILSDVGGAREMVSDGVNGYVYPAGAPEALASRLRSVLDGDELRRLGSAAREIVMRRFSADAMADRYEHLIWGARAGAQA